MSNNVTKKKSGFTKTEVFAGITTFMTMAYILAVNPSILADAGMNNHGVFVATIIASVIGTLAMALLADYPFALAPGMGLNAYFAYSVVLNMGYSWEWALTAVFVEGIIFILLTVSNVREAMFNAIPKCMKASVSAGIGLFIAFIGLKGAGIITASDSTLIELGNVITVPAILCMIGVFVIAILMKKQFKGAILIGILVTYVLGIGCELIGWYITVPAILCMIGVFVIAILMKKQFKGAILIGILVTYVLGIGCELIGWYQVTDATPSLIPHFDFSQGLFGGLNEVAFKLASPKEIFANKDSIINFIIVLFSFLFVDIFDTLGTLIGVAQKADFLDEEGKLPRIKQAFFADAIATTAGAVLGTSTVTTFVESSAGVAEGARTGKASIVTAICFALSIFFAPIFLAIPTFATAPALIIVGVLMLDSIVQVDFSDITEALPAFLTLVMMPFAYSISEGIVFGGIAYVVVKLFTGKRKDISLLMYGLAVLFIIKLIVA